MNQKRFWFLNRVELFKDLSLEDAERIESMSEIQKVKRRQVIFTPGDQSGHLYMIKITPVTGAPYYLLDEDGTGRMEYRRDAAGRDIRVPQWTLFSW